MSSNLVFNDVVTASFGFEYVPVMEFKNTQVRSLAGTRQSFQHQTNDKKIFDYLLFKKSNSTH